MADSTLTTIMVGLLDENPANPRKTFDDGKLAELAESIKSVGLLQPIVGWTIWRQTAKGWEVYTSSASRALIVRTMLDLYRIHVRRNLRERLPELVGKRLGCWCKPGPCHGDVLLELLVEFKLDGPDEDPQGDLFGGAK